MPEETISEDLNTDTTTETAQEEERHVPLSTLKDERAKRQALAAELAELKAAQEAAAQKRAEEQGEFQALYEKAAPELETLRAEVDGYRTRETARIEALTASNAERVDALPETMKALAPPGLEPDALSNWLSLAEKQSAASQQRPAGTQTHGGTKASTIPPELLERVTAEAAKHKKSPEWWWKIVRSQSPYKD